MFCARFSWETWSFKVLGKKIVKRGDFWVIFGTVAIVGFESVRIVALKDEFVLCSSGHDTRSCAAEEVLRAIV